MYSRRSLIEIGGWIWYCATVAALSVLFSGCATILSDDVQVKGVVKLSDNPASGHGGVQIDNGYVATFSKSDGSFELTGRILKDTRMTLTIAKVGYESQQKYVTIDYHSGQKPTNSHYDEVIDIGTITLRRIH
jgi:hypothetical protein